LTPWFSGEESRGKGGSLREKRNGPSPGRRRKKQEKNAPEESFLKGDAAGEGDSAKG